jgi:hypothetical protein
MLRYFISSLFLFSVLACSKPNPNPESLDPIYADLLEMGNSTHAAVEAAKKDLEEHEKEQKDAIPQTGQNKYAQKRVEEALARINKLEQMEGYYQLKAKSRLKEDRISYLKAYKEKKPWPPPEEWESYQAEKRLRDAPKNWDAKERLEQARREYGVDMSFHLGKKPAVAPKKEEVPAKEE